MALSACREPLRRDLAACGRGKGPGLATSARKSGRTSAGLRGRTPAASRLPKARGGRPACWERLAALFAAAFLANCVTLGSGGSGGVFGPGLYLGAMLGGACGALAHVLSPASTAGPDTWALVGTGAFFAARPRPRPQRSFSCSR